MNVLEHQALKDLRSRFEHQLEELSKEVQSGGLHWAIPRVILVAKLLDARLKRREELIKP